MMKVTDIKKTAYKGKGSIWKPFILLLTVSSIPIYYLFVNNVGKMKFIEAAVLIGSAYTIGLAFWGIFYLITKNRLLSGLIASIFIFFFMNYNIIYNYIYNNIIHNINAYTVSYLLSLIIAVNLSWLLIFLSLKFPWLLKRLTEFFLVILISTVLVNTVFAIPTIIRTIDNSKTSDLNNEQNSEYNIKTSDAVKPNIYFFISDEYASFSCIKKYYHFNNKSFYDYLSNNKFNISGTSYSYHTDTYKCFTDLASLCPVENISTANALKKQIYKKDNPQYQLLENLGYELKEVSMTELYPFAKTKEGTVLSNIFKSRTAYGESFLQIMIKRSALSFFSKSLGIKSAYPTAESVTDYFSDKSFPKNIAPTVYFSYLYSPHPPFKFDEFGNELPSECIADWKNPKFYLGQFKYTTKLISEAVNSILKNDPGSIIILQSDHGVRYHPDGVPPHTFIIKETDMRSILNAVYFEGKPLNIEGLSAVNTWRIILNKLGVDIPLLDDSSYKITVDGNEIVEAVQ